MILPPSGFERSSGMPVNETGVRCDSIAAMARSRAWAFEPHAHSDRHQLFWVNKGAGRLQIDGFTRGFSPNSVIFVPAGVVHGFEFTPVAAGWVITLPRDLPMPTDAPLQTAVNLREEQAALTAVCDEINREQAHDLPGRGLALSCQGGLLSVWLRRHLIRHAPVANADDAGRRLLRRFVRMLEKEFHTEHSVAFYADALEVTPTHLSRVCRQRNGQGANALIQGRTVLEARQRLAFTDQKIVDVARGLGFNSAAYFTRLFTARAGSSPSEFRRAIRAIGTRQIATADMRPA